MLNPVALRVLCVTLGVLALPVSGLAQFGGGGSPLSRDGTNHGGAPAGPRTGPASPALLPKPDPRQRLDAGALLCRTEDDLQRHEAAITARLDGNEAGEPAGCRRLTTMTPVSVIDRHGLARTQVRLLGRTEQTGWTDVVVHD